MDRKITADTIIVDALDINPNAGEILMKYGMRDSARRNGRRGCRSSRRRPRKDARRTQSHLKIIKNEQRT